jgi:hypothetical protein
MKRFLIALFLLAAPATAASAGAAACSGADPTVTSVVVKNVDSAGGLNNYQISGTVVNRGSASQASSVLQSVDIYQGTVKLDSKSIPPLKAGESYTFSYVAKRSADAGKGTTKLTFQLDPAPSNCAGASDRVALTF